MIERHLITFKDIRELQQKNQQLLATVQLLGEKEESKETDEDNEKVKELKVNITNWLIIFPFTCGWKYIISYRYWNLFIQSELERCEAKVGDLTEREKFLLKEIEVIKNQRDVYHRMFKQHSKSDSRRVRKSHFNLILSWNAFHNFSATYTFSISSQHES